MPDVELLVTELVANGVRHGGADRAESALHLVFERRRAALHVEVTNPDQQGTVAPRAPDMTGGGGLGLHIVERLSNRWGVRHDPRTAVWFELDCLL